MRIGLPALVLAIWLAPMSARAEGDADAWLDGLYQRIAADLGAGRPLVVHAHVPLCSNDIIRCGGHGLGDGDNPDTNLYWSTSGGFRGWFRRKGSGWTLVKRHRPDEGAVLEEMVWRRRVTPSAAWRRRGVDRPFDVYVVAWAWRGSAIDDALEAYVADLYGSKPRPVGLPDGVELAAGGAAQVVAFVGHNRWMDRPPYDWKKAEKRGGQPAAVKGTIAVACKTADYLAGDVPAASRVPLLMTTDFLFAGAHSFEGAVRALSGGEGLKAIRSAAARAYAEGQGKPVGRVGYAFTNPSDPRRWRW
jgi:hypothetical protein